MANIDKSLGDVLSYLDKKGIAQKTVIIFVSDNGGVSTISGDKILKGSRGSIYEGGIRVPLIVKWPGVTRSNTTNQNYVIMEDLYPTIANIAGKNTQNVVQRIDGKSFVKFLQTRSTSNQQVRPLYWHNPMDSKEAGYGGKAHTAVRQGDYKLIYFHESQKRELYHLRRNMEEQHDLSSRLPEQVNDLSILLIGHLKFTKAPLPVLKETGKSIPLPKVIFKDKQRERQPNRDRKMMRKK